MSFVVALTGFPGVGKLTIANAIKRATEESGQVTLVVDNQWICNPIFGLVAQDGITPLPSGVWEQVDVVNTAVFQTLEHHTPQHWNIILTAVLTGPSDGGWIASVARIARARHASFLPVRLICDVDENVRRITQPQRRDLMKSIDRDEPLRLSAAGTELDLGDGAFTLDVTSLTPKESASTILDELEDLPA